MFAVVIDPFFPENFQPELRPFEVTRLRIAGKGVGRGAHSDDRLARVEKLGKVRNLIFGELAKTCPDDHEIGRIERLGPGNVLLKRRVDVAALGINREKDGAVETVLLTQDLCQHRESLLGAVFLVSRDKDDLFAVGGAFFGRKVEPVGGKGGDAGNGGDDEGDEGCLHKNRFGGYLYTASE